MRSSKSRSRNKQRNRSVGNIVNRVFDSSGPEGKVRGTPQQIIDKYNQLARDAQLAGDRVATENFQQHSEHYTRMLAEAQREQNERREQQEAQQRDRQQHNQRNDDQPAQRRSEGDDTSGGQAPDQARAADRSAEAAEQERRGDPGAAPQPDTNTDAEAEAKPAKPRRSRSPRAKPAPAQEPGGSDDVIDLGSDDGADTGLVETPEEKPKRKPRSRKPKASGNDGSDSGGDDSDGSVQNDATAAE